MNVSNYNVDYIFNIHHQNEVKPTLGGGMKEQKVIFNTTLSHSSLGKPISLTLEEKILNKMKGKCFLFQSVVKEALLGCREATAPMRHISTA